MLKIVVGHSNDPDSLEAARDVIEQCQGGFSRSNAPGEDFDDWFDVEHV